MDNSVIAVTLLVMMSVVTPAISSMETVAIPVEDGITLSTDLYFPDKQPAPVILIRTPYGKAGYEFLGEAFSRNGYVVASQDVRGKYDSGGEHVPFRHERNDGLAVLEWIAKQDWCNGQIGMWGQSYSAFSSLVVADAKNDVLDSILAFSGWLDPEDIVKPGGSMHLMLDLPWMLSQQGRRQRNISDFDIDALFRHTPLSGAMRQAGIENSAWEAPDFLESLGEIPTMGTIDRPVLHITGWNDMVYRASVKVYQDFTARSSSYQKLIVGPWYHDQMMIGDWMVGDADFGEASGFGTDELVALSLSWFDATLKGKGKKILREPPVTFFMMGQNAWHKDEAWPPVETTDSRRWYLDSKGNLSTHLPSVPGENRFVYDPHNPVPTFGGANFHFFPELMGVRDQREIETREDVLVYTTDPLDEELQITGKITARLHVATSGNDTDFTAKLVVVRPDGYAGIVEEGIARASAQLVEVPPPGQPFALTVDLGYTAITVPAGDRIRLEVSSSNFPKYDRNPNTGENPFTATDLKKANQTVFHSPERPSFIELPVRRKLLVAGSKSRRPLVKPIAPARKAKGVIKGDPAELLSDGRRQLDEGEIDQAIATLEAVVALLPDDPEGHYDLGRAYRAALNDASMFKKLGLSKKIRGSYLKAIELNPDYMNARSSLASFYFNAPGIAGGSEEKGLEQVAEIRKRDPKTAHFLMGGLYQDRAEPQKAIAEYKEAIALDPENPDAWYSLGMVHQRGKEWTEAFATFEKGFSLTGDLRSLYQIGRTGVFSGEKLDRAREAFEEYIASEPDPVRLPSAAFAHYRLGMIFEKLGKKTEARSAYEMALELDPKMDLAKEALEKLG